ncbi:MAG: T9SS type A sorting domain-containing protein [Bacteroidia bacterium]
MNTMIRPQLLPFLALNSFFLFAQFLNLHAQVPIPNGDFEQWEDRFIFEVFPPYQTSNTFTFVSGAQPNVTSVSGETGGKAIRLETIAISGGNQEGVIYSGSVFPVAEPGFPFSGNPDSIYLRLRYDIQTGDTAGFVIAFFTNGQLAGSGMFQPFSGQNTSWHTVGFDLPSLSSTPDSVTILLASSWYDNTPSIAGSWLELDNFSFEDNSTLLNGDFSQVDSLFVHDPVSWISPNDFSLVFEDGDMIATEATGADAYMGGTSLRLTTQILQFGNDEDTVGFIQNRQSYITGGEGGQAYTGLAIPQTFRGYYKYLPVGNDTAIMYLAFSVWDSVGDSSRVIGDFYGMAFSPSADYVSFSLDLNLSEKPDSFFLAFSASDVDKVLSQAEAGPGSELYVDEIEFYDGATAIERDDMIPSWNIYPNPASDRITIQFEDQPGQDYQVDIYNISGQKVHSKSLPVLPTDNKHEISVGQLNTGIYFLSLRNHQSGKIFTKGYSSKGNV